MLSIPEFDVVLFDVGGTLLQVAHDPLVTAIASAAHFGAIDIPAFRAGVEIAVREWRAEGGKPEHEDLTITWVRHFTRALSRSGFEGPVDLAASHIEDAFLVDGWEVDPDAMSLLDFLRSRAVPMGVVSNWPATPDGTLERAGLREYFSVVVASGVAGYAKPRPEIFHIATNGLGVRPERALYVGDSLSHDAYGATACRSR
jgi:FMN phosphatase YigB (HAD superfamily)